MCIKMILRMSLCLYFPTSLIKCRYNVSCEYLQLLNIRIPQRRAWVTAHNIFSRDSGTPWRSYPSRALTFCNCRRSTRKCIFCRLWLLQSSVREIFRANAKFWIVSGGMKFVDFTKKFATRAFIFFNGKNVMYASCLMAKLSLLKTQHVRTSAICSLVCEHGVPQRS